MRYLLFLIVLFSNFTIQAQKIEFKKVDAIEFHSLIIKNNNHLLIDVGREEDHLEGYIKGAVFAETSEKLFSILNATPNSRPILIYCRYGKRSKKASWLIAEKYPHKIFTLQKGIESWKSKGFTVVNVKSKQSN